MTDSDVAGVNTSELLQEAMSLHQQGRHSEAGISYRRVLDLEPRNPRALRLSGILARDCGELGASLDLLTRLVDVAQDDPESLSELALTHMMAGQLRQADALFRQALVCDSDFHKALANLGALLHQCGHLHEAISVYRHCLNVESGDLEVRCNLANALMDAGKSNEALSECDAALLIFPDDPFLLANQGAVLCGLREFESAAQVLEQVADTGYIDDMGMINLGFSYSHLGKLESAVDVLHGAVMAYPDNARAAADLANAYIAVGENHKAINICESFLARYPGEGLVLANYAFALRDSGRTDDAGALLNFAGLVNVHEIDVPERYPSLAAFNKELVRFIQDHPSLLTNPVRKATLGGDQTGELNPADNAALSAFEALANRMVLDTVHKYEQAGFANHPAMVCAPETWTLRIWATVLRGGGRQTPHLHPMAWLSGVYYVQVPTGLDSTGGLEFGLSPKHLVVHSAPDSYVIGACEGRMVMFPSYFYHCTREFVSEQSRISIAFDVIPRSAGG